MKRYRFCCLDAQGHIALAFHVACQDDQEALVEGESICGEAAVEVWQDSRLIARLKSGAAPLNEHDHQSA
jgi:hypothetical protein